MTLKLIISRKKNLFVCLSWLLVVESGFLHPALPTLQVQHRFYNEDPEAGTNRIQEEAETTVMTIDARPIDDAAVSFLFKVKYYPFRKTIDERDGTANWKPSARFGGPETGVVKRVAGNNGVVAFGVDIALPGQIGGLGYGHQAPFQTVSVSSFRYQSTNRVNESR